MGAMRADTHFKKKRCNTTIIDDEKKQNTGKKRRHWQRGPKKNTPPTNQLGWHWRTAASQRVLFATTNVKENAIFLYIVCFYIWGGVGWRGVGWGGVGRQHKVGKVG